MLEILLVFFIFTLLVHIVDSPNITKLKQCTDVEEAVEIRKRIKNNRLIAFIIYCTIYIVLVIVLNIVTCDSNNPDNISMTIRTLLMTPAFMFIYLKQNKGYQKVMGSISTHTKTTYLAENKNFALYLRGFLKDDYKHDVQYSENVLNKFSEFEFTTVLQSKISTCAVGMTKEVDSPRGATRIYLNDASWKEDVLDLIKQAQHIYVLVDDRESCIWEIEQTKELLHKTTFIIDDVKKYDIVRSKLKGVIDFPDISTLDLLESQIAVIQFKECNPYTKIHENSLSGYIELLDVNFPELKKRKRKRKKARIALIIMFVLPLIALGGYITVALLEDNNSKPGIHNLTILDEIVSEGKKLCPFKIDEGTTLIDVKKERPYIVYDYVINESNMDIKVIEENRAMLEYNIKKSLTEDFKRYLRLYKYGLKYRYTGDLTKNSFFIIIEPSDMKDAQYEMPEEALKEIIDSVLLKMK